MKLSGYCFYMKTNTLEDFQICISVPLKTNSNRRGNTWGKYEINAMKEQNDLPRLILNICLNNNKKRIVITIKSD